VLWHIALNTDGSTLQKQQYVELVVSSGDARSPKHMLQENLSVNSAVALFRVPY
jgi:hypothetical protein